VVTLTVAVLDVENLKVSGVESFLMCLPQLVTEPDLVTPLAVYQVEPASQTVGPNVA
jgi:hypothetical protein